MCGSGATGGSACLVECPHCHKARLNLLTAVTGDMVWCPTCTAILLVQHRDGRSDLVIVQKGKPKHRRLV